MRYFVCNHGDPETIQPDGRCTGQCTFVGEAPDGPEGDIDYHLLPIAWYHYVDVHEGRHQNAWPPIGHTRTSTLNSIWAGNGGRQVS